MDKATRRAELQWQSAHYKENQMPNNDEAARETARLKAIEAWRHVDQDEEVGRWEYEGGAC